MGLPRDPGILTPHLLPPILDGGLLPLLGVAFLIPHGLGYWPEASGPGSFLAPPLGRVACAPPSHPTPAFPVVSFQIQNLGSALQEGDVVLSNHPRAGGSHLPDLTVITPVSWDAMAAEIWPTRANIWAWDRWTPRAWKPSSLLAGPPLLTGRAAAEVGTALSLLGAAIDMGFCVSWRC